MALRRGDIAQMAGVTVTSFNNLASRSLLPLVAQRADKHWKDYTPEDALRLRVFLQLAELGQPQGRVSEALRQGFGEFLGYAQGLGEGNGRAWYFGLLFRRLALDEELSWTTFHAVAGDFDAGLRRSIRAAGWKVSHVVGNASINVTECVRDVLARCESDAQRAAMVELAAILRAGG